MQLHLYANGLVGWSPEQLASDPELLASGASQSPVGSIREPAQHNGHWHEAIEDPVSDASSTDAEQAEDYSSNAAQSSVDSGHSSEDDDGSTSEAPTASQPSGMTDEEQISEIHAFIVGDDTEDADLAEAALMAATQLVSSLADSDDFLEPEVIETLQQLNVQLHSIDGGLKLEIDEGHDTRCIYIYGDDDNADISNSADSDSEEANDSDDDIDGDSYADRDSDDDSGFATAYTNEASSDNGQDVGNGVTCPVCLQGYSSNARMAALNCRHHVCSCCFDRLSRPKQCPICRARIRSVMEVII